MTESRWLDEREHAAWRAYVALQTRLTARLGRELKRESELSVPDYAVLFELSEARDGKLRIGELSDRVEWDKGRLSKQLTRMERRGLIVREPCDTDGRGFFAVLTAAGRSAIEASAPLHVGHVRQWFVDLLTPEQMDTIVAISNTVVAKLDSDQSLCPAMPDDA